MHIARKRFGQNFLTDKNVIFKIIHLIQPKIGETLLEIGPGFGALTFPLLEICKKLYAIELDRDIIPHLTKKAAELGELILYEGDALKFKFFDLFPTFQKIHCIGNLPYNISTPLIFHLLEQREWITDMHFMLQNEMVDRIIAMPGSKEYGRISVMVQYVCQAEKCLVIKPTAFNPSPKVDSAIIHLKPYTTLPFIANNEKLFAEIVRTAFNQRRKTITNSLKKYLSAKDLLQLNIDHNIRAEALSVADFVKIANFISTNFIS